MNQKKNTLKIQNTGNYNPEFTGLLQNICHLQNKLSANNPGVTGQKEIPAETPRRHISRWSWTSHMILVHAAPNHTNRPW